MGIAGVLPPSLSSIKFFAFLSFIKFLEFWLNEEHISLLTVRGIILFSL